MKDFDWKSIDFNDAGNWPIQIKAIAIALIFLIVMGLGWYFLIRGQQAVLDQAAVRETELKGVFESKQAKAVNIDLYKKQMAEIRTSLGGMLRQLPGKTEVEGLLEDISQTGLANGLQFELFKPEAENPAEFYAELPIKIRVTGDYHQFGHFAGQVAALPRIVTLHDISVVPIASSNKGNGIGKGGKNDKSSKEAEHLLMMEATARTYRYLEEDTQ